MDGRKDKCSGKLNLPGPVQGVQASCVILAEVDLPCQHGEKAVLEEEDG